MSVGTILKIGGGLLTSADTFERIAAALGRISPRGTLVLPGGGPFADTVRHATATFALDDSTAHWMAIVAMDQYALMLASRIPRAATATSLDEATAAADAGQLPILMPFQWLRRADPLPHSWDVTSDSIAAWVARQAGATRLVLVKPPGASTDLVDAYFARAAGPDLDVTIVTGDQSDRLAELLAATGAAR